MKCTHCDSLLGEPALECYRCKGKLCHNCYKGSPCNANVDHPAHYGGEANPYEVIKVIEAWKLCFHLGNVVKYVARAGKKHPDALEDLKKARWYLDRKIKELSQK